MNRTFARNGLALLIVLALLASALCAAAETAFVRYDSQEYGFSFEVNAGYAVYEQDGFVWVYPGQNNSNFRLNWIADGEVDEAAFFAQTGAALREAMGDSMESDPGEAASPMELRGIPMDAMIYAYTDPESGAVVEGAYLWEQREGYALLYGAAYLQEDADAVLSRVGSRLGNLLLSGKCAGPCAGCGFQRRLYAPERPERRYVRRHADVHGSIQPFHGKWRQRICLRDAGICGALPERTGGMRTSGRHA